VEGAYGQYELDYYFTSFDAAYEYIDEEIEDDPKVVAANFLLPPYYENKKYQAKLIDYYSRCEEDWDYAVVCNTFLNPYQLQKGHWPPKNTIHQIMVEGQPVLAILKRESKKDLVGVQYLRGGNFTHAVPMLEEALAEDPENESILIYLARGYLLADRLEQANETVEHLFEIYPDNEWGIDILGSIAIIQEDYLVAIELFEKNLANNYKFFRSYVNLARSFRLNGEEDAAVATLKKCLRINPFYEPAYQLFGQILIDRGEFELGKKMLEYKITGNSKYGRE
jgi:tetratricopeptide (TPR) repeat protein